MSVKMRQYVERQIVTVAVREALKAGYYITVNDDEYGDGETVLMDSKDEAIILKAMFTTDGDTLFMRKHPLPGIDRDYEEFMKFVYGNDGYDVLSDYTVNLESIMPEVNKEIEKWD